MKKLALGAVLAGFLAACGGGGSGDDVVQPIDARADSTTGSDGTAARGGTDGTRPSS